MADRFFEPSMPAAPEVSRRAIAYAGEPSCQEKHDVMGTACVKGLCTICSVSYNHSAFIKQSIESIWAQEYRDIEIIVVDDGSPDNSAEILNILQRQSPVPMKVILQENTGNPAANYNKALACARGEYVSFLSLDDVLFPDAISKKVRIMNGDGDVAFVTNSRTTRIDSQGASLGEIIFPLDGIAEPMPRDTLSLEYSNFHSYLIQGGLFRSEIVQNVGGFDEDIIGDDIVLRTKIARYLEKTPRWKFGVLHEPAVYYRYHGGNISDVYSRQLQTLAQYLERYWPEAMNPAYTRARFFQALLHSNYRQCFSLARCARFGKYFLSPLSWVLVALPLKVKFVIWRIYHKFKYRRAE